MNAQRQCSRKRLSQTAALIACLWMSFGCASQQKQQPLVIRGFLAPHKAALDAPTIVKTMRQAGFSDDQILAHGPSLRNALATQGGVRAMQDKFTLAMIMIRSGEVYGVSVNRGTFHFPIPTGHDPYAANVIDADNLDLYLTLGEALAQSGEHDKAQSLLERLDQAIESMDHLPPPAVNRRVAALRQTLAKPQLSAL
jgi:hypothetical protein